MIDLDYYENLPKREPIRYSLRGSWEYKSTYHLDWNPALRILKGSIGKNSDTVFNKIRPLFKYRTSFQFFYERVFLRRRRWYGLYIENNTIKSDTKKSSFFDKLKVDRESAKRISYNIKEAKRNKKLRAERKKQFDDIIFSFRNNRIFYDFVRNKIYNLKFLERKVYNPKTDFKEISWWGKRSYERQYKRYVEQLPKTRELLQGFLDAEDKKNYLLGTEDGWKLYEKECHHM